LRYGKKTVLLVEDSTLTRFSSKRLLENRGYEVTEAATGEEALIRAREALDPFDLVVVDIHLPGIDGLATIEKIKKIPGYRHVPVMILTADTKLSTVKEAIHLGAVEYLSKPFTPDQLTDRVDRLIGHSEEDPRTVLETVLRKEVNRARRGNTAFSLVLARRKTPGRAGADEIKRRLVRRMREIDEVTVLDEQNLALVLPLTRGEGAAEVIKKFEQWVPEKGWSFGPAVYPDDGGNEKEILRAATERLNEALRRPPPEETGSAAPEAAAGRTPAGEEKKEPEPGGGP
jgi:CheY-like chemotaxis protein